MHLCYIKCFLLSKPIHHVDHQPPVPFDLPNLLKRTEQITDWRLLGHWLKVPVDTLNTIEQNRGGDVRHCKEEVLNYWIKNEPTASWETLADNIESMGEYKVLVQDIRNSCCKQGTVFPRIVPARRIVSALE